MMVIKTLIYKASVDPKLLQPKICSQNNQKERAPDELCPVFTNLTKLIGQLIAGDKIVIPEELKKQVVDALHFIHPGSTKMLAESNIF